MLNVELNEWVRKLKFYIAELNYFNIFVAVEFEDLIAKDTVKIELEDNPGNYIVRLLEDGKEIYYTSTEYNIVDNQINGKFDYRLDSKYKDILEKYINYLKKELSILNMTLDEFIKVYNNENRILNKGE